LTPAQQKLVEDNLGLAHWLLNKYWRRYVHRRIVYREIRAAAYFGLCRAAVAYDPAFGAAFTTYATKYVWGVMSNCVRELAHRHVRHGVLPERPWVGYALEDYRETEPVKIAGDSEVRDRVADALRFLDDRAARIVTLKFGLDGAAPLNGTEIGRELGITRQRVKQIWRDRIIPRLRERLVLVANSVL
jgi:RNA polymerase sigma factor (sigma-70 family)